MKIDRNTVEKVAGLARLKVEESQMDQIADELSKILLYMDKLSEIDTDNVQPLVYLNDDFNRWRSDAEGAVLPIESALQNAPDKVGRYFAVPKILEK